MLLRKIEDVIVLLSRLVLLGFSVLLMFALTVYVWDKFTPAKDSASQAASVDWTAVKPDLKYVVEETGRDMGVFVPNSTLTERLLDPKLRPAFQQADSLVRDFIAQKPEHHARIEQEAQARGLAPVNPLLEGKDMPSAQTIDAYKQKLSSDAARQHEAVEAAATAEAAAAATNEVECCSADETYWSEPADTAALLHERATSIEGEHGAAAYAAFVQGAPQAIAQVLQDKTLEPKLRELTASRLIEMVLVNYTISFNNAVSELNQSDNDSLWDRLFSSLELSLWSLMLSFLVLVVFVIMAVRTEQHLRAFVALQGPRKPD